MERVFASTEQLENLKRLTRNREQDIARLGQALLDLRKLERTVELSVQSSMEAQALLGTQLARAAGIDTSKEQFTIDLETGELFVVREGTKIPLDQI